MIRFAWIRFRTQAAVGAGVLAVAAIALAVTGLQLAHAYNTAAARWTLTYQPGSRYWAFEWIETAIYLTLAILLAGLCFLRIRPGRSAEPAIHRPHAIRPAPALERSP